MLCTAINYDFQAGQRMGWTGFTWDKHLFPDPKMFLDWYTIMSIVIRYKTLSLCNTSIGVKPKV